MVEFTLWRIAGEVITHHGPTKAFDGEHQARDTAGKRVVVVAARSFAEAHECAHEALEHNWSPHTTGSTILAITPVKSEDGEPFKIMLDPRVYRMHARVDPYDDGGGGVEDSINEHEEPEAPGGNARWDEPSLS